MNDKNAKTNTKTNTTSSVETHAAQIGALAMALFGAEETRARLNRAANVYFEDYPALRRDHEAVLREKSDQELRAYLHSQIGVKLTPAQAWAQDDDGMTVAGTPHDRWRSLGLEATREFVSRSPELGLMVGSSSSRPLVGLTERQREIAKEFGLDEEEYARRLATQAAAQAAAQEADR